MEIDIRSIEQEIRSIRFSDPSKDFVFELHKYNQSIRIEDSETTLAIASKEDAENLIKALQKAIELNWWE